MYNRASGNRLPTFFVAATEMEVKWRTAGWKEKKDVAWHEKIKWSVEQYEYRKINEKEKVSQI